MITHIHHINFIVKDLNQAIERFEGLFGGAKFLVDTLEKRAVKTARLKLGDTWFVLVQPTDPDSIPGKHLRDHGEGFFLVSLGTDELDAQLARLAGEEGITPSSAKRRGLENWQVVDLPIDKFFGTQIQLCEEINS